MSSKLFYENRYLKEFDATVKSCTPDKKGWAVVLDRTAFYPEGGGQPCDHGVMTAGEMTANIIDVREKNGQIIHYSDTEIPAGTQVHGEIDWKRRFDMMQQHTGEHIFSGVVNSMFGYNNVGFHLSEKDNVVDFDGFMTKEDIKAVMDRCNETVWLNQAVTAEYPENVNEMEYRSKKELSGPIRIVAAGDADVCACCGTHVSRAGEIGMVKMLSVEKFREGVRMEMICGKRVLDYLQMVNGQNHEISVKLSAKPDQTAKAVQRLQDENFQLKGRVMQMEEELFASEAEKWQGSQEALIFKEGLEADSVRRLADLILRGCSGQCAVFSRNADGTYKYAIGAKEGDLRAFTKEMNAALNGRGGGKPLFVQGSVQADEEQIRAYFTR